LFPSLLTVLEELCRVKESPSFEPPILEFFLADL